MSEPHRPVARGGAVRLAALGASPRSSAASLPALVGSAGASAAPAAACDNRNNNTYQKLLECVTVEGVREHQEEFQKIAENNPDPVYPGTRAAGTPGYQASVDYVAGLLEDAGYNVTLDPVEITFTFPPVLRQLTPVAADYETGVFSGSGEGAVDGRRHPGRHQPRRRGRPRCLDERLRAPMRTPPADDFAGPTATSRSSSAAAAASRQGAQRRAGGRLGRRHLQPGQHAGPRGA